MDFLTTFISTLVSAAAAVAVVQWLAKKAVEHGLAREIEAYKAKLSEDVEKKKGELSRELASHQLALNQDLELTKGALQRPLARETAQVNGAVRKEIENQFGETAAQRQYEMEARRRLYLAVGPLRFQLLLSCRDLAGRIESMGVRESYKTNLAGYYGRSTCYRILRPVAICDLIEEQVALADFSVDPTAIDRLRFRRTLTRIFSGGELVGDHPDVNWTYQNEHVFADSLSSCANVLIDRTAGSRVLRFREFDELIAAQGEQIVSPFDGLLNGFRISEKPILWMRFVAQANACNELIKRLGGEAFERHDVPVEELLKQSGDPHICKAIAESIKRVRSVELLSL